MVPSCSNAVIIGNAGTLVNIGNTTVTRDIGVNAYSIIIMFVLQLGLVILLAIT